MKTTVEFTRHGSEITTNQYEYKGYLVEMKKGGSLQTISSKITKDELLIRTNIHNNSTMVEVKLENDKFIDELINNA